MAELDYCPSCRRIRRAVLLILLIAGAIAAAVYFA